MQIAPISMDSASWVSKSSQMVYLGQIVGAQKCVSRIWKRFCVPFTYTVLWSASDVFEQRLLPVLNLNYPPCCPPCTQIHDIGSTDGVPTSIKTLKSSRVSTPSQWCGIFHASLPQFLEALACSRCHKDSLIRWPVAPTGVRQRATQAQLIVLWVGRGGQVKVFGGGGATAPA